MRVREAVEAEMAGRLVDPGMRTVPAILPRAKIVYGSGFAFARQGGWRCRPRGSGTC